MLARFLQTTLFKRLLLIFTGALLASFILGFVVRGSRWRLQDVETGSGALKAASEKVKEGQRVLRRAPAPEGERMLTAANLRDSDLDGIPDSAELRSFSDRENFRRWFTAIAEMQFYQLSDEWGAEQRDCAGLVRFSWREALRRHDRAWFQRMGQGYEPFAPDVSLYTLETSPLGEKLFRTNAVAFKERDLENGSFSEFADARSLKDFNCDFIGLDRRRAEPGDLLFFFQPWAQKLPYHVMIFLGEGSRAASGGARDWVVYHTGATPKDAGAVKKVRLSVLDRHPDKRWRPVPVNPNFLGFYRLKILD
jgi:uncharacterized protein YfaT (DUF1175 family)